MEGLSFGGKGTLIAKVTKLDKGWGNNFVKGVALFHRSAELTVEA